VTPRPATAARRTGPPGAAGHTGAPSPTARTHTTAPASDTPAAAVGRRAKVWFVGAGPGAADLLTLRAARVIGACDVVVWASSLVHPDVLAHARPGAELVDSAQLPLEGVAELYRRALAGDLTVARIHSGDPALWGAVAEQRELCDRLGLAHETVPGVSAYSAVAAIAGAELTVPEVAQSVILTRLGGGKTPMPAGEQIADLARHGTSMAVFLSAARSGQLQAELLAGGYPPDTPVVVAYQATWPGELIARCTVGSLAQTVKERKLWKHTLFLVGPALSARGTRSHLYHPGHFHGFRRADRQARDALLAAGAAPRGEAGRRETGHGEASGGEAGAAGTAAAGGAATPEAGP
jgi:precorrin-4/cobalt-precorrin-4 C11-methyltransferase